MRLAYVTTYDAADLGSWSGLGYFIAKALELQSIELIRIGPLNCYTNWLIKTKQHFYQYVARKNYRLDREPRVLHSYANQVANRLKSIAVDVVFSPGTIPICYLRSHTPVVFWTDATYAGMIEFYPGWSNLCGESLIAGNRMEQAALSNCRLAIYSSHWAAKTAMDNYQVDPSKVKVVPFGPNVESERQLHEVRALIANRPMDICQLLFLAVDWDRKGGDLAVELADSLNRRGLRTQLTIAGCYPSHATPSFVSVLGFVSKASKDGQSMIDRLLEESHFLVLPTRADCVPVAIAEANSFGVPVVTSDVGGIPTVVRGGVNGAAFPVGTFVEKAADFISDHMANYTAYQQLAEGAFGEYETRLNWQVAGNTVRKLLEEVCL